MYESPFPEELCFSAHSSLVKILPVSGGFEYAKLVRTVLLEEAVSAAVLELSPFWGEAYAQACSHFPCMCAACDAEHGQIVAIEPASPFTEAVRSCREFSISLTFGGSSESNGVLFARFPVPDASLADLAGLPFCWELFKAAARMGNNDFSVSITAKNMAYGVKEQIRDNPGSLILVICSFWQAEAVKKAILSDCAAAPEPYGGFPKLYAPDRDSIREICAEMPFINAAYEWTRLGKSVPFSAYLPSETESGTEEADEEYEGDDADNSEPVKRSENIGQKSPESSADNSGEPAGMPDFDNLLSSLFDISAGGQENSGSGKSDDGAGDSLHNALANLPFDFGRLKFSGAKLKKLLSRLNALKADPLARTSGEHPGFAEIPSAPQASVRFRKFKSVSDRIEELEGLFSQCSGRIEAIEVLFRHAEKFYADNTGESVKPWQKRMLARFLKRYCRIVLLVCPDLYRIVAGAKACVDDNFAYETWDLATFYPWKPADLPSVRVRGEEVWGEGLKTVRFRRKFPSMRLRRVPVKRRDKKKTDNWAESFSDGCICSYPPEDVVIEDYGRYLGKKAVSILSGEQARIEEFSVSMLDGIDMRETLRNWHMGHKLYVREDRRVPGEAGSIVIIFDDDNDDKYSWCMCWQGEHDQESDQAFFATPKERMIVGPGIARCEYGGFLLSGVPGRMFDIWTDPNFSFVQKKSEVLLMAAIEYSLEKYVVYVAASPPRSFFKNYAARAGRKIVYIPLGQLSPVSLKKLRVFHVLSGHSVRSIAKDYIW
ncbi:MAG: hypothetical protein K6G50_01495 [bacterium]|nr:hypothetical protein [bacterium]